MSKKNNNGKDSLRGETWVRLRTRRDKKKETTDSENKKEKEAGCPARLIVFFLVVFGGLFFFEAYNVTLNPFSISRRTDIRLRNAPQKSETHNAPDFDRYLFSTVKTSQEKLPVPGQLRVVRLATWNLDPLDFDKMTDPRRGPCIADVLSRFDVVAIQGIHSRNRAVLDGIIYLLRGRGLQYACLCATWDERAAQCGSLAFLFNTNSIETDGEALCEMTLPDWRNFPSPLVGSFRAIQTEKEKAFTFYLINVQLDKNSPGKRRDMLRDVYEHVRKTSGRRGVPEDDIILLGTFGAPPNNMGRLAAVANLAAVNGDLATELNGLCSDNIVFDARATSEYVERFGVIDLGKTFDLSPAEEAGIATHRPVWADFSVQETANRE
ncbi:MAG: hypothetical protein Q4G59_09365 [Planctomycetia bacterium]|nr:hypothetical protein [Planctomycetia bacterium]